MESELVTDTLVREVLEKKKSCKDILIPGGRV